MILYKDALRIIENITIQPRIETVTLENALNRVIAQDIFSIIDLPSFNKSIMDGFALATKGIKQYKVQEIIAAGDVPRFPVRKQLCTKVMTGAMIPEGAEFVVKVEDCTEENGCITINAWDEEKYITKKGSYSKAGDKLIGQGALLTPGKIALLAENGINTVKVYAQPHISILLTGSELVRPGEPLLAAQKYECNGLMLNALLEKSGISTTKTLMVKDDPFFLKEAFLDLFDQSDIVLTSGGISMGDYDYLPALIKELGFQTLFQKVKIKPGKPTLLAQKGNQFVIGLPGNPLSTFTSFELFVKPLIQAYYCKIYVPTLLEGSLSNDIKRVDNSREEFLFAMHDNTEITPLETINSGHTAILSEANCLIPLPLGAINYKKGSKVNARQI